MISQAGFTAIDDLVHGFGGDYLSPVVPAPGQGQAATASMAALRAPRDQRMIGPIDLATTRTQARRPRGTTG